MNMNTVDKIQLKCDCIDRSVKIGVRQPILFNFNSNKPPEYKVFCETETTEYIYKKETLLKTITFY